MPQYKVGDRVKLSRLGCTVPNGSIGTVLSVDRSAMFLALYPNELSFKYLVEWDNGRQTAHAGSSLGRYIEVNPQPSKPDKKVSKLDMLLEDSDEDLEILNQLSDMKEEVEVIESRVTYLKKYLKNYHKKKIIIYTCDTYCLYLHINEDNKDIFLVKSKSSSVDEQDIESIKIPLQDYFKIIKILKGKF